MGVILSKGKTKGSCHQRTDYQALFKCTGNRLSPRESLTFSAPLRGLHYHQVQTCQCPTAKRENEAVMVPSLWHSSAENIHRISSESACARERGRVLDLAGGRELAERMKGEEVPICWF